MSVVLPCRCCNVAVGWHFHTAKFCAQSLNLYPGILKYFTIPYKNISILIKLQFRQNIRNILFLFQSKYFKWTKYFLTASASLEEMISCRARTERACSITNTHWERSGGTFWNSKIVNIELLQCFLCQHLPCPQCSPGSTAGSRIPQPRDKLSRPSLCRRDTPCPPGEEYSN